MSNKNFEQFTIEKVSRSKINMADYNPRIISESAKKKLKSKIKKDGLVIPITVNRRTGNIVAGHQRVSILDELYNNDYELTVAYIDVDKKKEVELNIFLNNQSAMGEWDKDLLYDIKKKFKDMDFISDAGFDKIDMNFLFSGMNIEEELFTESKDNKKVLSEIEKIKNSDKIREYKKQSREKFKEQNQNADSEYTDEHDYYITFVFNTNVEKINFMKKIKKKTTEKYLKASALFDIIKDEYKF